MFNSVFDWMKGIVDWGKEKIDQVFGFFGFYSSNYSKLLVYGLLLFIVAKMLRVKLDWKVGG